MTRVSRKTTKTSLETKHLHSYDYRAIISSCSDSTLLAEYATTGLVCAPLNKIQEIIDLSLFAQVVIKPSDVVILRCCLASNCSKVHAARATRLFFLTRPINCLICGVVVDAQAT